MGTRYLLDTNIAIYLLNGSLPPQALAKVRTMLATECNLSIIAKIELLGWPFPDKKRQSEAENFTLASNVYRLTDAVADRTILLRRAYKIKLGDAVIAATALEHNFILITRNTSDFAKIGGLSCLDPFDKP
ncbi:MAG TPA: type II toxin-antitoxin system VapC family toxin [Bacteroidetes bacterium]|nr:type II toxin-antitoxin system VapC family toxin [Bacteroidota bacterium]